MNSSIKFIHASDLHLGSALQLGVCNNKNISEAVKNATFTAFSYICQIAIQESVDFIVLSGDIYDREARSVLANEFFNKQCIKLGEKEIPLYVVAGNHDPIREGFELFNNPPNVFLFDSENVQVHQFNGEDGKLAGRIFGQSYRGRSDSREMHTSFNPPDTGVWNVGLLHTQLDPKEKNYVPCSLQDLASKAEIHYWALGHMHKTAIIRKQQPVIAYPGVPQGRHFGEEGFGGCLVVEMSAEKSPDVKYIPSSPVVFKRFKLNLGNHNGISDLYDIADILMEKSQEIVDVIRPGERSRMIGSDICDKETSINEDISWENQPCNGQNSQNSHNSQNSQNSNEANDSNDSHGSQNNHGPYGVSCNDYANNLRLYKTKYEVPSVFKGYIVQWIITGKTELHDSLMEQEEEICQFLTEKLQQKYQWETPFLWVDSVVLKTEKPLPESEILKDENPVFKGIYDIIDQCLNDDTMRKKFTSCLGDIWEAESNHEDYCEYKFALDEETFKDIVDRAKSVVIEKLLKGT